MIRILTSAPLRLCAKLIAVLYVHVAIAQDAEFVLIRDGAIMPTGAVSTVSQLASNAVVAVAAAAGAQAATNAAAEVAGMVAGIQTTVNGLEGVGYIRGYILSFGVSGMEPSTNVTCSTLKLVPNVSNDATYAYCDLYAYFSEAPATWPTARMTQSLRDNPTWSEVASVAVVETNVLIGATLWDCYRNTVAVPVGLTNVFFRIYGDAAQSEVGAYLPVKWGIQPGSYEPLTGTWIIGTNVVVYQGGLRVHPPE